MCLCVPFLQRSLHFSVRDLFFHFCVIHTSVLSFPHGLYFITYNNECSFVVKQSQPTYLPFSCQKLEVNDSAISIGMILTGILSAVPSPLPKTTADLLSFQILTHRKN